MLKKTEKNEKARTPHKKSEFRFAGWVSSFFYISVICYKSRDIRFGLLPRQKEHTDDQLGHIHSIMLNQIMVTSLFSFPVINCTIKSGYTPILNA
jgi:hypothetical protein